MEGALRANILTGINQTANQITQDNCAALDCDLVEVSAHIGARPSHAAWQGKIYSLSGQSTKYPSFKECCKPGEPDGIGGINCRHSYYPYFEGTDPLYSDGELDELKEPRVTYNGKELTQYEAEQKLRAVERQIRKYKRKAACCAEMHLDATNEKQKIGEWQALARDFCIQTGIRRDSAREYIGTKDGKQPRGIPVYIADRMIPATEINAAMTIAKILPDEPWEDIGGVSVAGGRIPTKKKKVFNEDGTLKKEREKEIDWQNEDFTKEKRIADFATKHGHTVYLIPEKSENKNPDAIMDGAITEFKTITGGISSVAKRFNKAMKQAENVVMDIKSDISINEIYNKILGEVKFYGYKTGTVYIQIRDKMYCWKIEDMI